MEVSASLETLGTPIQFLRSSRAVRICAVSRSCHVPKFYVETKSLWDEVRIPHLLMDGERPTEEQEEKEEKEEASHLKALRFASIMVIIFIFDDCRFGLLIFQRNKVLNISAERAKYIT